MIVVENIDKVQTKVYSDSGKKLFDLKTRKIVTEAVVKDYYPERFIEL